MSAALQLPVMWGSAAAPGLWQSHRNRHLRPSTIRRQPHCIAATAQNAEPDITLAFYRKHTERMLRRYLYASMQVGRAPSVLSDPVARGWVSSRPVRTFEDAVIFVLDVERCLDKLPALDRQILSRVVLQEYTQVEAAALLGMSTRAMSYKFLQALDRLTAQLLQSRLLILPH